MRATYKRSATRAGREVIYRECDCTLAQRERSAGRQVHLAFKFDYRDADYICTATGLTVRI